MKIITIRDYRNYDPDNCRTGGAYGFTYTYTEQSDGSFTVRYDTTSDFEYCTKCGTFGHNSWDCDFNNVYTADDVQRMVEFCKNISGIEITEKYLKKYQVNFTDWESGATLEIDSIMKEEGYTAEDYVKDCMSNADEEWCEMLANGTVTLYEIEE